jgi:hypothetical protein
MPLFAVLPNHIRELCLAHIANQIRGGPGSRRVHAHVQQLVPLKAEAAARLRQLHRGHAQIGQGAIDGADASSIEHRIELAEIGMHKLGSIAKRFQSLCRDRESRRVSVQSNQTRGTCFEQRQAVSAGTECAVNEQPSALGFEKRQDLLSQNRFVKRHRST